MADLDADIRRGLEAERLLKHELLSQARTHIDGELWRLFREVKPDDVAALQHIKAMQYFHGKYFAFFERAVTDGKIAQINLDSKKKTLRERVFG